MAKLFMLLIGATPPGRHTEQHDVFFGIADSLRDLIPQLHLFWPEAGKTIHLDAWREVSIVDGYRVRVVAPPAEASKTRLFFVNLGGYKKDEFEEFHYKMIVAAGEKGEAVRLAKQTAFYRHTGFKGANSHIDDKYGIDVDDVFEIADILAAGTRDRFRLVVEHAAADFPHDEIHLGYFKLDAADKWAPLEGP